MLPHVHDRVCKLVASAHFPYSRGMKRFRTFLWLVALLSALPHFASAGLTALVGGRLIDGFGGPPLANSVILVEGERIKTIGQGKVADANTSGAMEILIYPTGTSAPNAQPVPSVKR